MADFIRRHRTRLTAIGEVGLDFWIAREDPQKALQREIFKLFIQLAVELDLPLNIHSRSAGRHAVALLLENNAVKVQLHAFDGKVGAALPAVEAGYLFSIPPSLVRSRQKQKLVKQLPLDRLLVETDSPVLGPDASRRNEPANLPGVVRAIAQIKNVSEEAVAIAVCENTARLYGNLG
jgi:TatD DNase family protein